MVENKNKSIFIYRIFILVLTFQFATTIVQAADYSFVRTLGTYGTGDGEFQSPYGVDIDAEGNVYVADSGNHRIQKFDNNGNFLTKWGSYGSDDGQFNFPIDVSEDSEGNVYVADYVNNRIQKFNRTGFFLRQWGSYGSNDGQFNQPVSVSVDLKGNVYVADGANQRIQKFDSNGNFLTKWGTFGVGNGQFSGSMFGVSVDPTGNVYIAENSNCRIQKFDNNGNFLTKWGSYGSGNGDFACPVSVSVDLEGNVYVADTYVMSASGNHRIQKFDSNGNYLTQWGSYGYGNGEFTSLSGISVDSVGNVYTSELDNSRIQVFAPGAPTPPVPIDSVSVSSQIGTLTYGTEGSATFTITVAKNGGGNLNDVELSITGLPAGTTPTFNPPLLDIGNSETGGTSTLTISTSSITPAGSPSFIVKAKNSNTEKTAAGTLILDKATPTITWNNPIGLFVYGFVLDGTQLNAVASTPGNFAYTPESGTILDAGYSQNLHLDFTPTDTTNYNTISKDVYINVEKAIPTITVIPISVSPSKDGESVTFKAMVSSTAGETPDGTVQFKIDGINFGTELPLSGGSATSDPISTLSVDTHEVMALYFGNRNFEGYSGTLFHVVNPVPELSPLILTSAGLMGVMLIIIKYKR